MCKECLLQFCSNNCPNYDGYIPGRGRRKLICSSCGIGIYDGEEYFIISGETYCKDCVSCFSISELAEAFDYPDIQYLIEVLGGKICQG